MEISDMVLMVGRGEIKSLDEAEALVKKYYKKKADQAIKYAKGKMKVNKTEDISRFLAFVDTALTGSSSSNDDEFRNNDDY